METGSDKAAETEDAARWREGRRRHETIRHLIDRHGKHLPQSEIIDAAWELNVSRATFYRLIELYREFGTVDVLQPAKLGRRRGTRALSSKVEQIIETEIKRVYLKPTRPTVTHLLAEIHARCAEEGVELPHRRTVEARIRTVDARVRGLKRGESHVIQATSVKPGEYTVNRPLEVVQIDHTEIDIIVVDEQKREPIPARPWLTLAIDVFSRTITGFHISMSAPSRISVGLCLLQSVFDKAAWLQERSLDQDWPITGLPEAIHVDNATEFKSRAFVTGCENEGINIIYRPPAQPHFGGHIERLIGTMMGAVHLLPGTTFSNPMERREYDSAGAARMTLRELENYLAVEITGSYHQRIHAGLQRAPIAVWREFSASASLRMPSDRMKFWISFLPDDRRVLRPDGLHLFGLKYWHGALARSVGRSKEKMLVRYDPRDISRVFVKLGSGSFVEARWHDLTLPPISLHEWRNELRRRNKKARDERDTAAMMKAIAAKRQIVEQAIQATLSARKDASRPGRSLSDEADLGTLRGVDSRVPVPGEE